MKKVYLVIIASIVSFNSFANTNFHIECRDLARKIGFIYFEYGYIQYIQESGNRISEADFARANEILKEQGLPERKIDVLEKPDEINYINALSKFPCNYKFKNEACIASLEHLKSDSQNQGHDIAQSNDSYNKKLFSIESTTSFIDDCKP